MTRSIFAAVAAVFAFAAPGSAETVTHQIARVPAPYVPVSYDISRNGNMYIPMFDPSLGTLTSAQLMIALYVKTDSFGKGYYDRWGESMGDGYVDAAIWYSVNGPLGVMEADRKELEEHCYVTGRNDCTVTANLSLELDKTFDFTSAADLAVFQGTGFLDDFAFSMGAQVTAWGDAWRIRNTYFLDSTIQYTFDLPQPDPDPSTTPAVPLPAGAPLLIAGLGALVALRRRQG